MNTVANNAQKGQNLDFYKLLTPSEILQVFMGRTLMRRERSALTLATSLERCAGPGEKCQDRAGARGGSDRYFQHGDQRGSRGGVFQFRLV